LKQINDLKEEAQKHMAAYPQQKAEVKTKFETLMKQIENKANLCKNLVHNA
jgi:transcription initiation factor TFIID subunit TAF12